MLLEGKGMKITILPDIIWCFLVITLSLKFSSKLSDAFTIHKFSPDTMTTRLFEAARTGNLQDLKDLLRENPLILHTITLSCTNNPLHIASAAGHVSFVSEITRLRPDFAKELNEDGFSPIHIAAANGNVEVVEELLKVDPNLCRLEGREKKTPLHSAAIKGKVDVIRVMLLSCADCIEDVTIQQETALHLAIRSNQFEAVQVLVDWIREKKKDSILNLEDEQNNTVLHLATWKKQRLVIELLLGDTGSIEVNAMNQSGLTALDLLHIFPSASGDLEVSEILQRAGAKRARDLTLTPMPESSNHHHVINVPTTPDIPLSHPRNLVEYFKFKKGRDKPSQARSALLVIAVLITTATFQVGLSPPGGVWQDSYDPNRNNRDKPHTAGKSVMASSNRATFLVFVIFNSIGFNMSLYMINILTSNFPLQLDLRVCIVAMLITYNTAMTCITPLGLNITVFIVTIILSVLTPFVTKYLKVLIFRLRRRRFSRRESS